VLRAPCGYFDDHSPLNGSERGNSQVIRLRGALWQRGEAEASSVGEQLVYAIGDIHGRIDLLETLLEQIQSDAQVLQSAVDPLLVFLGDFIDRGPDSRAVIDRVMDLKSKISIIALRGNHEDSMIRFLEDPEANQDWLSHGGLETLRSYGVVLPQLSQELPWSDLRDRFAEALPPSHLEFLRQLGHYTVIGDYVFAHAGVRPDVSLDRQTARDLMWIRKPFLDAPRAIEQVVVHGHTPTEEPHMGRWRIGVDTGAYATGVLTAVRLRGAERAFVRSRTRSAATREPDLRRPEHGPGAGRASRNPFRS
jgi:serine/threonine protein phosphatase 1